jgi:hypothetical protein
MRVSATVIRLSILLALLSSIAATAGLLWPDGGVPFAFTTLQGETVEMYGRGLYRNDTLLNGAGYKGADVFVLAVGVPLLLLFTWLYRRGSLRGGLLLTGTLAYFFYNGVSMTFGYAYNSLFLVYLGIFSISLFALVLVATSIDVQALALRVCDRLPRRLLASYLFVVGAVLVIIWVGLSILPALVQGEAPERMEPYTTLVTHALDAGIISPVSIMAGVLLLRRAPLGYFLTSSILILSWVLGLGIVVFSAAQVVAGVITTIEVVVFVVPFIVLTATAIWLSVILFRNLEPSGVFESTAPTLSI